MLTLLEPTPEFSSLDHACKELTTSLFEKLPCREKRKLLVANSELFFELETKNFFFVIVEGSLALTQQGTKVLLYEEGDVVGFENPGLTPFTTISNEFAVVVDMYNRNDILAVLATNAELPELWRYHHSLHTARITYALWNATHAHEIDLPTLKPFDAGSTIISEGTTANEVYTLVQGEADVFVDSVKVGEILVDEIFGALAGFSKGARTATVVARTNCLALCLEQEQFIKLIRARPELINKLVQNMAHTIAALNTQVVALKKS